MRQRTPGADEHVCNRLGCLSASVGAGHLSMLYRTELFDVSILVKSDIAVLTFRVSHSSNGTRVIVDTGHVGVINMLGREQVVVRLELLVVGRGSETETSGGPSEL
eukprot:2880616-Pyramimonas_sp.AAC.1